MKIRCYNEFCFFRRSHPEHSKYRKTAGRPGLRSEPSWGAHTASPDSQTGAEGLAANPGFRASDGAAFPVTPTLKTLTLPLAFAAGTSSDYLGQVYILRSLGQGQGHTIKIGSYERN